MPFARPPLSPCVPSPGLVHCVFHVMVSLPTDAGPSTSFAWSDHHGSLSPSVTCSCVPRGPSFVPDFHGPQYLLNQGPSPWPPPLWSCSSTLPFQAFVNMRASGDPSAELTRSSSSFLLHRATLLPLHWLNAQLLFLTQTLPPETLPAPSRPGLSLLGLHSTTSRSRAASVWVSCGCLTK